MAARRGAVGNASLTILFLVVHTSEVWTVAYEGRVWWFDCVVGLVVCGLALARELNRLVAAAAGLAIAAATLLVAEAWQLPQEPGVAATLALIVLVASVVRASPVVPAAAIASAGAALTGLALAFHPGLGAAAMGLWWAGALTAGLLLRFLDTHHQARLAGLIGRYARKGTPVRLLVPDGLTWPPEVATTIYRVVRASLTNVTRHAALATAVTVTISRDQHTVTIEVADDAPATGDRVFPGSGQQGRSGIRERIESLGGTYRAGPDPGCGWSVRATVPVAAAA
jgi:hypothetical protein